ncbi:O-antigen ligase family protein [Desulforhopalus singaporensis]|uniref:O-antigen ligase n=1 Tax=Desulforhopalus singaporensis TaxID=91360 RepID=A0A1H0UYY7_9BACT|nr:O-antigen ligase family protein [Desulforhopalus singaporensis]SDP71293.1 O-antigen ligase [Desulforhopalus singaporensis]
MKNKLFLHTPALFLICAVITTVPLVFGAVHPIVLSVYVFILLFVVGSWVVLNGSLESFAGLFSFGVLVPLVLVLYLILQTVPIPLSWLEIVSPNRAHRVEAVNRIAGAHILFAPISENSVIGFYRSFFLVSLMIYFFALKKLISSDTRAFIFIFYCVVGVGIFEALYGLVQFVKPQLGILWLPLTAGRAAHGSIIYKNQYASLLNMIWPVAVGGIAAIAASRAASPGNSTGTRKRRDAIDKMADNQLITPVLFAAVSVIILAVLFSLSRGGILTLLLVALLLIVMVPFSLRKKIFFLLLVGTIVGTYGALLGFDTIASRFGAISGSGNTRLSLYSASLPLLKDHLWTGIGLGSYNLLSPVYLKGFPVGVHFDRAHNEYLELFIELGLPMAGMLFLWLLVSMARLAFTLRQSAASYLENMPQISIGIGAFCGLVGFFAHGLVDFGWRLPANLIFAVTLAALSVTSMTTPAVSMAKERRATPAEGER